MTYRGRVEHGVVILDGNPPLEDGTIVRVEPVATRPRKRRRGSAEAILQHAGIWEGVSDEVDRLLEELRQMKQDELKTQRAEPDAGL